jgi:hypothetical protein
MVNGVSSSHRDPNPSLFFIGDESTVSGKVSVEVIVIVVAADDKILDYRRVGCKRGDHQASAVPLGRRSLGRGGEGGFEGVGHDRVDGEGGSCGGWC